MIDSKDTANTTPILVFSENEQQALELIAAGTSLALGQQCELILLACGQPDELRYLEAIQRGADEVLVFNKPDSDRPSVEFLAELLGAAILQKKPRIVLGGDTHIDREVFSRASQRLKRSCASGCTRLQIGQADELIVERRVLGGRFIACQALFDSPKVATVQAGRFEPLPLQVSRTGKITNQSAPPCKNSIRILSSMDRERSEVDIGKSTIIVAAGRGVKTKEDLSLVHSLATALDGAVAATRPLTDDLQWLPPDQKVGLSGRTVKPNLYIACGISGQIEHVVGHRSARTVVAINSDPDAPIHAEADYSVVADLYTVLTSLIEQLISCSVSP